MIRNILLLGGTGYIGGRVARFINECGNANVIIATRSDSARKTENQKYDVARINWESSKSLTEACKGIDCVIHMAGLNEVDCYHNPIDALVVNGLYSLRLLEAAISAGVERFIYFSTAHVYGAPLSGVLTENSPAKPVNAYAITHRVTEDFVLVANASNRICGIVLRISNVVGAPTNATIDRWSLIVNQLCKEAVVSKTLTMKTQGMQKRDFISMQDVAKATQHFTLLDKSQVGDGLFNLGGNASMRIIDIVTMIAERCNKLLGFTPKIIKPNANGEEPGFDLNFAIAKMTRTGFTFESNIEKAIDETLIFCAEHFN